MKFVIYKIALNSIKLFILIGFVVTPITMGAQSIEDKGVDLGKTPPRIIRACCAFGYDLKIWGVPFVSIDQVINIDDLSEHHYMGNKSEGTGTIYTNKGGFIDIGHLRDQIDWTRYLYTTILDSRGKGEVILPLRNEAGRKILYLNVPAQLSNSDCILLAGKITYDLSLWHEISTWFGASTIPFIPEKFSSFSVEDVYSNLLGIHVGMKTLHSKLPFNEAATMMIKSTLDSLDVAKTAKETYDAYDAVNNKWYTNKKRIPSTKITLKRDPDVLISSRPWIIPNETNNVSDAVILDVPLLNTKGELLTNFYQFTIDLNYRFPVEEIFPGRKSSLINQDDFGVLLNRITNELQIMEQNALVEKKESKSSKVGISVN
ncbi:DUF4056 domain-containing protein [uncultured Aquimarina sp.]|uniref:DUF4056 domain-containing protein n=1 Tax=uncultured Aquimarina sp. TaxID=575652 RepID=UPI00262FABDB|nr:DUF4056 domain-containing protein [uncultured Aquimarina sp.]